MTAEAQLIPLSALQHFLYCPRQCALIHNEQVWAENRFTAEGQLLHKKGKKGSGEKGVREKGSGKRGQGANLDKIPSRPTCWQQKPTRPHRLQTRQ